MAARTQVRDLLARKRRPDLFTQKRPQDLAVLKKPDLTINKSDIVRNPPGLKPPPPPRAPGVPPVRFPGDAIYFSQLAQNQFNRQQKLGGLLGQEGTDRQDVTEALRRRLEQKPRDEQNLRENYNRSGLLFSGKLSEARGLQEEQFLRQQADEQQAFDRRQASRLAARQAIESGAPIEDAALYAQSVDRQLQRDQLAADSNALAGPPEKPVKKPTENKDLAINKSQVKRRPDLRTTKRAAIRSRR